MTQAQVYIASTKGPVAIQRIVREEDIDPVVCINGRSQVSSISDDYYGFVRKGTGVVESRVGHSAFRLDLETEISGNSWQLAVALAHELENAQQLYNEFSKLPQASDVPYTIWATGIVNNDEDVCIIDKLIKKLEESLDFFESHQQQKRRVYVFYPEDQQHEVSGTWLTRNQLSDEYIKLTPVATLGDAIKLLPGNITNRGINPGITVPAKLAKPRNTNPVKPVKFYKISRWQPYVLLALLLISITLGFEIWRNSKPLPTTAGPVPTSAKAAQALKDSDIAAILHGDRLSLTARYASRTNSCNQGRSSQSATAVAKNGTASFQAISLDKLCELDLSLRMDDISIDAESLLAIAIDPNEKLIIPLASYSTQASLGWVVPSPGRQTRDRSYQVYFLYNPDAGSKTEPTSQLFSSSALTQEITGQFAAQPGPLDAELLTQTFRDRAWAVLSFSHTLLADW